MKNIKERLNSRLDLGFKKSDTEKEKIVVEDKPLIEKRLDNIKERLDEKVTEILLLMEGSALASVRQKWRTLASHGKQRSGKVKTKANTARSAIKLKPTLRKFRRKFAVGHKKANRLMKRLGRGLFAKK